MSEKVWDKLKQELKDFCVSNCFDGVVMGLSGGIDSALTTVLAADTLGGKRNPGFISGGFEPSHQATGLSGKLIVKVFSLY